MKRLSCDTLAGAADDVLRPAWDRQHTDFGMLHLGVGAFMRAHVAVYTDDALAAAGGDWAIAGVSLRHRAMADRLDPQDGLYAVRVADDASITHRVIGALRSMTVAPEDPEAVVAWIADARIRIITLTVTEKGYCLAPESGALEFDHEGIRADLAGDGPPVTTIGYLVRGLERRRHRGAPALTVLSCDNLPSNGQRLEAAIRAFAGRACPDLCAWLDTHTAFPATMVDRIVPATTDRDIAASAAAMDLQDQGLVKTEPFTQWVIEDRFAGPRPAWEAGGAVFTDDVAPWETAKLRLLNGPHSALAYLGFLAGFEFIHEVVANEDFAAWTRHLMIWEIAPVTATPAGLDQAAYMDALLARFSNSTLGHRTWQIAMDGSQKLPQRLLRTIRAQLDRDGPVEALCLAVAAWMRYALGRDEAEAAIDVQDPLTERFAQIADDGTRDAATIADRFLTLDEVFGRDLPRVTRFRSAVTQALASLLDRGAAATVRAFLDERGRP